MVPSNHAVEISSDLRAALAAIAGVEQVWVGDEGAGVLLLAGSGEAHGRILREALASVREAGLDAMPVDVVVSATHRERRVRYDRVQRVENPDRSVSVRVTLEWESEAYTAEATGEKGETIELRTTAQATIAAVEAVTGKALGLRLVGVKHVRAFDGELVVVSIYGGPGQKTLLGSVLAGNDPFRATAVSVLMALNRMLGNYLVTR